LIMLGAKENIAGQSVIKRERKNEEKKQ
jgi:hypothetical protein